MQYKEDEKRQQVNAASCEEDADCMFRKLVEEYAAKWGFEINRVDSESEQDSNLQIRLTEYRKNLNTWEV